jgi:hypothetical protein
MPFCDGQHSGYAPLIYPESWGHPPFAGLHDEGTTMRINTYQPNASNGFTERRSIDELSQQPRPDPASRCLNRPYDFSELIRQTITCGFWPH